METSKKEIRDKFNRPGLEPSISLLTKSWRTFRLKFIDFVEMYIWGLVGAIPLLALSLVFVVLNLAFNNFILDSFALRIFSFTLLSLAVLWSLYYGVRAHIGVLLLIIEPNIKVKDAFIKTKDFFYNYVIVSILSSLLLSLLFLSLIIPGIIFSVYWSFATILVVLEGLKTTKAALARSKELVKGYWWPVLGRMLLVGFLYSFLVGLITLPAELLSANFSYLYSLSVNIIATLLTPFLMVYTYNLYKDLLVKK